LFVNPTEAEVAAVLALTRLDALQVYGTYDIAALKARFGLPVWRAGGVSGPGDLPVDCGGADLLLMEAKAPAGATRPGGNAVTFDWSLLRGWAAPCPWMLAGGLHPGNVAAAIRATGAGAVDVSSGVESASGVKDAGLIRAFVAAARGA
jgi:phosphoribosylanthranilate isomerase